MIDFYREEGIKNLFISKKQIYITMSISCLTFSDPLAIRYMIYIFQYFLSYEMYVVNIQN